MRWLPERQAPAASPSSQLRASEAGVVGVPVGHQVATRPPAILTYSRTPGFAAMENSQLSVEVYAFLRSIVPNPDDGMWYASTQAFGNRLEATVLAVGTDCLLVANGVQSMRRHGVGGNGRPQLRRAGLWDIDYVKIPFRPGTCHVSTLAPGSKTVAGGIRPGIDTHRDMAAELSNLPAVVQDHLESYVPAGLRLRRWIKALGPTAAEPERLWLFTTSTDQLAYVHGARWHRWDPSGLAQDPATVPWAVTVVTAIIGRATRQHITLAHRGHEPASYPDPRPAAVECGGAIGIPSMNVAGHRRRER